MLLVNTCSVCYYIRVQGNTTPAHLNLVLHYQKDVTDNLQ
jgi:hypothetical protein